MVEVRELGSISLLISIPVALLVFKSVCGFYVLDMKSLFLFVVFILYHLLFVVFILYHLLFGLENHDKPWCS
jgi:hypothetical protein